MGLRKEIAVSYPNCETHISNAALTWIFTNVEQSIHNATAISPTHRLHRSVQILYNNWYPYWQHSVSKTHLSNLKRVKENEAKERTIKPTRRTSVHRITPRISGKPKNWLITLFLIRRSELIRVAVDGADRWCQWSAGDPAVDPAHRPAT